MSFLILKLGNFPFIELGNFPFVELGNFPFVELGPFTHNLHLGPQFPILSEMNP